MNKAVRSNYPICYNVTIIGIHSWNTVLETESNRKLTLSGSIYEKQPFLFASLFYYFKHKGDFQAKDLIL